MDNKLVFLLLFGLASVSSAYEYLPNGCPADFSVHILLPHESDCGRYYMCSNGQKHLFQCPGLTLFDFVLQGCDWADNVICQKQSTTTQKTTESADSTSDSTVTDHVDEELLANGCPVDMHVNRLLPHESDCTKFYQCAHGDKVLHQCPAQLYFDVELQVCNWSHLVDCQLRTTTESIPMTTEATLTPEPTTEAHTETTTAATEEVTDKTTTERYTITESEITSTPQPVTNETDSPTTEIQSTNEPTTEPAVTELPTTTTIESTNNTETVTVESVTSTTEILSTIEPTTELPTTTVGSIVDLTTIKSTEYYTTTSLPNLTTENETTTQVSATTAKTVTENPTTPESGTTEPTEPGESAQICPEGYFGNIPHPEMCNAYYLCSLWQPILLSCPRDMEFDSETRVCVQIAEGGCTWYSTTTTTQASWETSTSNISTTEAFGTTEGKINVSTASNNESTVDFTTIPTTTETTNNTTSLAPETTTDGWRTTTVDSEIDLTTIKSTEYTTTNLPKLTTETETTEYETTTQVSATTAKTVTENPTTPESGTTEPTEPGESSQICPEGYFGNIPHPEMCNAYYLCSLWQPILLSCPRDMEFDPETRVCVQIAEGGCTWYSTTTTTQASWETSTSNISTTEAFGTTEGKINVSTASNYESTVDFTTIPTTTETTNNTTSLAPETTTDGWRTTTVDSEIDLTTIKSTEYTTTNLPKLTTETETTEYETTTQVSATTAKTVTENPTTPESGTTEPTEPGESAQICPEGYFGNIPHPEMCNAYYLCSLWQPILLSCPRDMEFDPETRVCVQIAEGGCTWYSTTTTTQASWETSTSNISTTEAFGTTEGKINVSTASNNESTVDFTTIPTTTETTNNTTSLAPEITTGGWTVTESGTTQEVTTETYGTTQEVPESSTEAPEICPPGFFGMVANPDDCTAYTLCSLWEPIPMFCSTGFEFSPVEKACVLKAEGGCTWSSTSTVQPTEPTETGSAEVVIPGAPGAPGMGTEVPELSTEAPDICPPGFFGMVANPDDCTAYILCSLWEPIPMFCATGFEFSPVEERCIQSNGLGCRGRNNGNAYTVHSKESDGALYDAKTNGVKIYENEIKPPKQSQENKEVDALCPSGFNGFHEDSRRCDRFFLCSGDDVFEMYCPAGAEFNVQSEQCIPITDSGCTARRDSEKRQKIASWTSFLSRF